MKKIAFIMQVLAITIALPLLSIMELKHVPEKATEKKANYYLVAPAEKTPAAVNNKIAS